MTVSKPEVVIIGGGFAGLEAAKRLADAPVHVTVVDRENHHLFQPLLYQVATAELSPGTIATPIRSAVRKKKNVRVILDEITEIRASEKRVALVDGTTLAYDYLVIAAGATNNYFGNDQWAEHAHPLKNLRDAIRMRERILLAFEAAEQEPNPEIRKALLTFVVIGGGPTGVEMAGAIAELGKRTLPVEYRNIHVDEIRVILMERTDRLLRPFSERLSARAKEQLEELGVEVSLGHTVTDVTERGVDTDAGFVPATVILWASGVRAESVVASLGVALDRGGRVHVDQHCAVLGHPDIFGVGDVACFTPEGAEFPLPGLASVAMQQGRYVGDTIHGDLRRMPRRPFQYRDKGIMATIGRSRAVAQTKRVSLSGLAAWLAWGFVHIWYIIGFHNRSIVLFDWIWSYYTFGRGERLVTAPVEGRIKFSPDCEPLAPSPGSRSGTEVDAAHFRARNE